MQIKTEDLVAILKKMDEVEDKAGVAFSSSSEEDMQIAMEKMRELRAMLYAVLAKEEEGQAVPYPVAYPVVVPYREVPWWGRVTCKNSTGGKTWERYTSSSATGAE